MKFVARLIIWSILLAGTPASAADRSPLTEHFTLDSVRVFYTLTEEGAVPETDTDGNGVPDRIEDIALQVATAKEVFCEVLDFPDPFESERYPGVNCIQVSVLAKDRINGLNGVAYRKAQKARLIPGGTANDRAIVMAVASTVDPRNNLTPAHEMFHLIQYGASYFGNRWYLEGMARWSERALGKGGAGKSTLSGKKSTWPQSRETREKLYQMKYEASLLLWNPISLKVDPGGGMDPGKLSKTLANRRYTNGEAVIKDDLLSGASLMREILLELGKLDEVKMRHFHQDKWSLAEQNSPDNDPYIYEAVMNVLRRHLENVGKFEANPEK